MLKQLVCAGAAALLLGGAAPVPTSSAASAITQSRVMDPCYDDCIRICLQHTGDYSACQFECMMTTCLAEAPLEVSRLPAFTRKE